MTDLDPTRDPDLVALGADRPVWDQFFTVCPLVIVGTREEDGRWNLAPKHMAMPLGWDNYFGFMCTPAHSTWQNARREGCFTVSFPRPSQILLASLTSAPRCEDDTKPALDAVATRPATVVDGVLVRDAHLHLECETHRIVDGFGENGLITGRIVETLVAETSVRRHDRDDEELVFEAPLLAYVSPGRWAEISHTFAFPFHEGWSR